DQDDGTGNPATATDTAHTDCQPPLVANVHIDPIGPEPNVTFNTNEPTSAFVHCALTCNGPDILKTTDLRRSTSHTVKLLGLAPYTRYFLVIQALDIVANETIDDNHGPGTAVSSGSPTADTPAKETEISTSSAGPSP
ncbi:MAG: hypothetical protein ACYS21_19960, partial [Planctomycetota bacterium]